MYNVLSGYPTLGYNVPHQCKVSHPADIIYILSPLSNFSGIGDDKILTMSVIESEILLQLTHDNRRRRPIHKR